MLIFVWPHNFFFIYFWDEAPQLRNDKHPARDDVGLLRVVRWTVAVSDGSGCKDLACERVWARSPAEVNARSGVVRSRVIIYIFSPDERLRLTMHAYCIISTRVTPAWYSTLSMWSDNYGSDRKWVRGGLKSVGSDRRKEGYIRLLNVDLDAAGRGDPGYTNMDKLRDIYKLLGIAHSHLRSRHSMVCGIRQTWEKIRKSKHE